MGEGSPADAAARAERFFTTFEGVCKELRGPEILLAALGGEDSAFVRFNRGLVRQAGAVSENEISLDLVNGHRHAQASATLGGDVSADVAALRTTLERLRAVCSQADADPYLNFATERHDTFDAPASVLPPSDLMAQLVLDAAAGADLVGVLAVGPMRRAFANSLGQRNWFEAAVFHLDVSFHAGGAAAKASLGGTAWDADDIFRRLVDARETLMLLERPAHEPRPGRYRAYLAPRALEEIFALLSWGSFGLEAHRTRQTALIKMITEDRRLHPSVTLRDDRSHGAAAPFTSRGFIKPREVVLIEAGRYRDCLVDARSAKQYGAAVNAEVEWPEALTMAPGDLGAGDAAALVGNGLFVSDLWYTNFSDRNNCAITGMTRYACFWVEDGRLAVPLAPMRFDESLYYLLGDGLVGLTRERERLLDQRSYGGRSLRSMLLPGIVTDALRIAL